MSVAAVSFVPYRDDATGARARESVIVSQRKGRKGCERPSEKKARFFVELLQPRLAFFALDFVSLSLLFLITLQKKNKKKTQNDAAAQKDEEKTHTQNSRNAVQKIDG